TGMLIQALALAGLAAAQSLLSFIALSAVLGWGTAMVYPTFLATVADNTHPRDRAKAIGIFRLWRDLGYAVGALLTGIVADAFNTETSIGLIAAITAASAIIIALRMNNRYDRGRPLLPTRHTNTPHS